MSHLRLRSSGYYFRKVIPVDLRSVFNKQELLVTLGTHSKGIANHKASYLLYTINYSIQYARKHIQLLEIEALRQTISQWLSKALDAIGNSDKPISIDPIVSEGITAKSSQPKMSVAMETYFDHKRQSGEWRGRTASESIPPFELFVEIMGDKPINTYTREDARYYRDTLLKMPSSRRKRPQYRDLSISELLATDIPEDHLLRKKTVNSHLILLSSCFKWFESESMIDKNVIEGLQVKQTDSISYKPYTDEELKSLLSLDVFTDPGNRYNKTYKYWTPLLALYTGARLNELCQLRISDIGKTKSGIWYIDINDEEDKSTKNKSSIRRTPIHYKLIEIGFIDYVNHIKSLGFDMLFPDLKKGNQSWKDNASKSFANMAKKACIKSDRSKCFHSFRKNAVDAIAANAPKDSIVSAIVGHRQMGMTFSRYFSSYPIEELKSAIDLINYDVDDSHLIYGWKQVDV